MLRKALPVIDSKIFVVFLLSKIPRAVVIILLFNYSIFHGTVLVSANG